MELNLQSRKEKYLDLTMVDGRLLRIKKPSEELIKELEDVEFELKEQTRFEGAMNLIKPAVIKILNNNTTNVQYDTLLFEAKDEDGEKIYSYDICMAIYKAYTEFYSKVLSDPN